VKGLIGIRRSLLKIETRESGAGVFLLIDGFLHGKKKSNREEISFYAFMVWNAFYPAPQPSKAPLSTNQGCEGALG